MESHLTTVGTCALIAYLCTHVRPIKRCAIHIHDINIGWYLMKLVEFQRSISHSVVRGVRSVIRLYRVSEDWPRDLTARVHSSRSRPNKGAKKSWARVLSAEREIRYECRSRCIWPLLETDEMSITSRKRRITLSRRSLYEGLEALKGRPVRELLTTKNGGTCSLVTRLRYTKDDRQRVHAASELHAHIFQKTASHRYWFASKLH